MLAASFATWREGGARVQVVSDAKHYPEIMNESSSTLDDTCTMMDASSASPPPRDHTSNINTNNDTGDNEEAPVSEEPSPECVEEAEKKLDNPLDNDLAAVLWSEEFEERYETMREESRSFERFRSLEVEDYLRVHRTSRYFHKLKVDYFGNRMNTLSIHRLEQEYLKQGKETTIKRNVQNHKKHLVEIQEEALPPVTRLPPIQTAIGFLEAPEDPKMPSVPTTNPAVLRESRRRNAADLELRRQLRIKDELESKKTSRPREMKYFPLVI